MKMDLKYESYTDLNQPQHIAAPRNLNEERERERVLQVRLPFGSKVNAG